MTLNVKFLAVALVAVALSLLGGSRATADSITCSAKQAVGSTDIVGSGAYSVSTGRVLTQIEMIVVDQ